MFGRSVFLLSIARRRALAAWVAFAAAAAIAGESVEPNASRSMGELSEPLPLTALGRSVSRVVVVANLPGVCRGSDWRGELPRWLSHFLPRAPVVVWDARKWRYGREHEAGRNLKCSVCMSALQDGTGPQSKRYQCSDLHTLGEGDLIVVIGSGTMGCAYKTEKRDLENCKLGREEKGSFPSLEALDLLWDKSKAITVHFPVRALHFLSQEQNLFGFKHIVPDDSFFKPMGMNDDSVNEIVGCFRHTKNQDLLYVARYREYKGQLKFIKQADPALLTNYTIHFYGSGGLDAMNYMKEIDMMGHSRGIKVAVHHHVSKQTLLQHSCHAAGQILWPSQDSNPRAAYEGLYAGMPLFISTTAGVPKPLLEQPFVQAVPFNASVDDFNASLGVWMDIVASHRTSTSSRRRIIGYTKTALDPENVYWELCERIGICAARPEVAVDDALEESTGRDASSVQQKDPQREI